MHDMTTTTPTEVDVPMALRMARARRDLPKHRWAKEVGIHPSLVGRYEKGERSASADLLQRWAAAAGVTLTAMLKWGEKP